MVVLPHPAGKNERREVPEMVPGAAVWERRSDLIRAATHAPGVERFFGRTASANIAQ
jgi:hypothetical protein